MANELIKYDDLGSKIQKYTNWVVWSGSKEQIINNWLKPVYRYAKDEANFYGISNERDCGWYIKKDKVLKMLKDTIPNKIEWQNEFNSILSDLSKYIITYKEPQCE